MAEETVYVIDSSRRGISNFREIWDYRELFYFFIWRDVKVKYKQTVLGIFWVVVQPVVSVIIFSFFFAKAMDVSSAGLPYPVFVFSGLLLWNVFSTSVNSSGNSMLTNAPIIKKIYFPRLIVPISSILVAWIDFFFAFIVFVGCLIYYKTTVDIASAFIFWPASILLAFFAMVGVSCWLAALNVKYKDFRYLLPFMLQVGLFVTPVIYPVSIVDASPFKYLLAANPMYAPISLFRAPLTLSGLDPVLMSISIVSTIFFLIVGVTYFTKTEAYFADLA